MIFFKPYPFTHPPSSFTRFQNAWRWYTFHTCSGGPGTRQRPWLQHRGVGHGSLPCERHCFVYSLPAFNSVANKTIIPVWRFGNWKYQISAEIEELGAKKGTPCAWCHVNAREGQNKCKGIFKTHIMKLDEIQNKAELIRGGSSAHQFKDYNKRMRCLHTCSVNSVLTLMPASGILGCLLSGARLGQKSSSCQGKQGWLLHATTSCHLLNTYYVPGTVPNMTTSLGGEVGPPVGRRFPVSREWQVVQGSFKHSKASGVIRPNVLIAAQVPWCPQDDGSCQGSQEAGTQPT